MQIFKRERLHWLTAAKPLNPPKKHHVVIRWAAVCATAGFLLVSGKSLKVQADAPSVLEITAPGVRQTAIVTPSLPPLKAIAPSSSALAPRAEVIEKVWLSITGKDGLPVMSRLSDDFNAVGVFKRPHVNLTKDLAKLAKDLSTHLAANNVQALITSGVRTSKGQLELIKDRIAERGMLRAFPGLATATIKDTGLWIDAWEWLKARRVPVNPPADYVDDEGKRVGGSLHLKGMAIDLIADDLDQLKSALQAYAASPANRKRKGLRIAAVVREPDCVHLSLTR